MKQTHRFRRVAAMALLALIVPSLLAACGGGASATATSAAPTVKAAQTTITGAATSAGPTTSAAATTVTGAATSAAPTTSAAATTVTGAATSAAPTVNAAATTAGGGTAAKSGGQLVVGVSFDDFITFDPGHFYEVEDNPIYAGTYEPLVRQNPPDLTKFQPVLAKEIPTTQNGGISADGKVYTFKLRDNVKFHSGNIMTADDWVFSLTRLHFLSDNPSFLADPYSTKDAVNIKAVDKMTVQVTLADVNVAFLSYLATSNSVVVDSKLVKEKGGTDAADAKDKDKAKDYLDQNSAGTGPFILKSFKLKEELVLDKNPNYWRDPAKLDRIVYKAVQGSGPQRQQLEAGTIDIAEDLDADAVAELNKGGKFTVITGDTLNHTYLALNTSQDVGGPLANKLVRQAIGYSIDYKGIIDGLRKGQAVQPPTIVPQGLLGVDKAQQYAYKTDIAKAKDLVKQANAVGQTVKFTFNAGGSYDGIAAETWAAKLKADIEQSGLKVELAPVEPQQRLGDYRAGKLQFTISGWSPDYADVHTYADPFGSSTGAAAKRVKYNNPEVDKLLSQGLKESDPAKRGDIYTQIQKIIVDDAPFLVLEQPKAQIVMKKSITGYVYHPVELVDLYALAKTA